MTQAQTPQSPQTPVNPDLQPEDQGNQSVDPEAVKMLHHDAQAETPSFDITRLLGRFHASMSVISLICLGIVYKQWGPDHLLPCALGSALVWVNMIALAYGIRGVFNQQKSLI